MHIDTRDKKFHDDKMLQTDTYTILFEIFVYWWMLCITWHHKYTQLHQHTFIATRAAARYSLVLTRAVRRHAIGWWRGVWCAILIAHKLLWQNTEVPVSIFQESPLAGEPRERLFHIQCPPLPTLCKISLPIYVIVTNKLLQPLTTTWYGSLVLSFSLLKI